MYDFVWSLFAPKTPVEVPPVKKRAPTPIQLNKVKVLPLDAALLTLKAAMVRPGFIETLSNVKIYSKTGNQTKRRRALTNVFPIAFSKQTPGFSSCTLAATLSFWEQFRVGVVREEGQPPIPLEYVMKVPKRIDNHSRIRFEFKSDADEKVWVRAVLQAIICSLEGECVVHESN